MRLRRILVALHEHTLRLDESVSRGYDLSLWDDQMKFLHALQLQAQMFIDIVLLACAMLGHSPETPRDAINFLRAQGLLSDSEADFAKKVVSFRNIVVHRYLEVDLSLVDKILRERLYRRVLEIAANLVERLRERGIDD